MKWRAGRIAWYDGNGERVVTRARLRGPLAIFEQPRPSYWCALHLPTQMAAVRGILVDWDVLRIANYLLDHYGDALARRHKPSIRAKCPAALFKWIDACQRRKVWLDPKEYGL